jgi:hypothetical protein
MRKGQQEMIGFVVIVLLIVIVATIFLSFSIQKSKRSIAYEYQAVNDLLYAMMKYTTNCNYKKLQEVVRDCVNEQKCKDRDACEYVKEEIKNILNSTIGRKTKYGWLNGYQIYDESKKLNIGDGLLEGNVVVAHYFIPGSINANSTNVTLILYFGARAK